MRSLLGRFHRPNARSQSEQLFMLNSLGDGSTLSLDFTTMGGVLDPRLTFTRSTNATFINSSGYVEWANANMYWNTAFEGLSGTNPSLTGSGWGYVFSSGNAVFNGDGTVTVTTTSADRRVLFRSSGFSGNGLRVIAAVDVTISSGTLTASQVMVTGTPTNAQHYVNGTIWNSSHPLWNGGNLPVGTAFTLSYATDSLTGSTTSMWFGVGCSSAIAGSATFSNPRWTMWKGSGTVPYYPNTSATNNSSANYFNSNDYQAPRFDYDPTTLTSRGLLIEGSATNFVTQSNGSISVWGTGGNRTPTNNTTDVVSPDGTNNATKLVCGTATTYASFATPISGLTGGATYTISYWIRGPVGHSPRLYAQNGTTGDVTATATTGTYNNTGWTRLTQTYTLPATTTQVLVYFLSTNVVTTGDTFYVYGFQMETGSGASSHIPTGASTGFRAADKMSITDISTMQWNQTEGTFALHMDVAAETNTSSFPAFMGMYTATPVRVVRVLLNNSSGTNPRIGNDTWTATPTQILSSYITRPTAPTAFKFAVALSNTGQTLKQVVNAGSVTTTSGTGTMQTPTQVLWHQDPSVNDTDYFSIHIRSLKYWPTALPNAQLQALTT